METQVVKNIGPMFFKLIKDTMIACSSIVDTKDIDSIMDSIVDAIYLSERNNEDSEKYQYNISVVFKQELFFCGDEPIDYTPHLPDRLYVVDTMDKGEAASVVMMRRDYWKLVTGKDNLPCVAQYIINGCKDINPNLMMAQLMADIYERTRYKLVTDYMRLKECDHLLEQSRILNLQWVETMLTLIRSENDWNQKVAAISPSLHIPIPNNFKSKTATILMYRSYKEEIKDGVQS